MSTREDAVGPLEPGAGEVSGWLTPERHRASVNATWDAMEQVQSDAAAAAADAAAADTKAAAADAKAVAAQATAEGASAAAADAATNAVAALDRADAIEVKAEAAQASADAKLPLAGGTVTGDLVVEGQAVLGESGDLVWATR